MVLFLTLISAVIFFTWLTFLGLFIMAFWKEEKQNKKETSPLEKTDAYSPPSLEEIEKNIQINRIYLYQELFLIQKKKNPFTNLMII